jgi:hypothetical protein
MNQDETDLAQVTASSACGFVLTAERECTANADFDLLNSTVMVTCQDVSRHGAVI